MEYTPEIVVLQMISDVLSREGMTYRDQVTEARVVLDAYFRSHGIVVPGQKRESSRPRARRTSSTEKTVQREAYSFGQG